MVDGENNPVPVPVHIPVDEPPVTVPVIATVGLLAQGYKSGPIDTIGAGVNLIYKLSYKVYVFF